MARVEQPRHPCREAAARAGDAVPHAAAEEEGVAILDRSLDRLDHLLPCVGDAVPEAERVADHIGRTEEEHQLARPVLRVERARLEPEPAERREDVALFEGLQRERRLRDRREIREDGEHGLGPPRHLRQQRVKRLQQLANRVGGGRAVVESDGHVEIDRAHRHGPKVHLRPRLRVHHRRRREEAELAQLGELRAKRLRALDLGGRAARRAVAHREGGEGLEKREVDDHVHRRDVDFEDVESVARHPNDLQVEEAIGRARRHHHRVVGAGEQVVEGDRAAVEPPLRGVAVARARAQPQVTQ